MQECSSAEEQKVQEYSKLLHGYPTKHVGALMHNSTFSFFTRVPCQVYGCTTVLLH